MVHIYNGILLNYKKNEIMLFAATWMDLEIITVHEGNQPKTNITWYPLYAECFFFKKDTNELIYKTETDSKT